MPTTKATKEAAQVLGVSVGTMRNWSDQYADSLSETARPGHLPERRFTDHDITTLTYIKQLRSEGLQAEQIRERLAETSFTDVEIIQQQATTEADKPQQTTELATPSATDATPAVVLALQAMQTQIDALQQASKAAQQNQRDTHAAFYRGMLIGVLIMLGVLIVGVLLAYMLPR